MNNRINNFLIGLLWLLASTLAATFWFNVMYGFNIFSVQHWQHLAYMQAIGQTVKLSFYISLVVIVIIVTFGFYILLQPRFRHITMPIFDRNTPPKPHTAPVAQPVSVPGPQTNVVSASAPQPTQKTEPAPQPAPTTASAPGIVRPPRLNIPTVTRTEVVPRVPLTSTPKARIVPETEYADIRAAFESAGYVYKGIPKIRGVQTAIIAIGTGEVLWVGAVGVMASDMQRAVETLSGVFSDTLDDIEININAFIIAPVDSVENTGILSFETVNDLRNYISGVPNTPPDEDDQDNFDAYSGYIGTVVDYIGKI